MNCIVPFFVFALVLIEPQVRGQGGAGEVPKPAAGASKEAVPPKTGEAKSPPKPESQPKGATPAPSAPQEPPAKSKPQPPSAEQIAKWIAALKVDEDPHNLATRLSELGKTDPVVRKALFALVPDGSTPPLLFSALVNWIVGENDRSLEALGALAAVVSGQADRRPIVLAGLERMDRREALLPTLLERIVAPADARTAHWISTAHALVRDSDAERCDLADALIKVLQGGSENGTDATVRKILYELTLQNLGTAGEWRAWFDGFVSTRGRAGFTYPALHEYARAFIEDAGRTSNLAAIEEFVKLGVFPPDRYVRSGDARVRLAAFDGLFRAAGDDQKKRKVAADKLLLALERKEGEREPLLLAMGHLGALVDSFRQNSEDLRGRIAAVMRGYLSSSDPAIVVLAVRGLGKCRLRGKGDGDRLTPVANAHTSDLDITREIIRALNELKEADGVVSRCLVHPDASVGKLAAEVLGRWGDRAKAGQHAVALAEAWAHRAKKENDDPATRRSFILALDVLGQYNAAPVTEVLKQAIARGQADQFPALTATLAALGAEGKAAPTAEVAAGLRSFLVGFVPTKLKKDDRETLVAQLGTFAGDVGAFAVGWAVAEPDAALRAKLVEAITRSIAGVPFDATVDLVVELEAAKAWADADALLSALIRRASAGTAPESEASRGSELKLRRAGVLEALSRAAEAEKLISEEISRLGDAVTAQLLVYRAQLRRRLSKNEESLADYDLALKRGGEKLPEGERKAIHAAAATIEYELQRFDRALARAEAALKLAAGPADASIRLLKLRAGVRLRKTPEIVDRAVADYEKLATADASVKGSIGEEMAPHLRIRGLVAQLDAAGADVEKARAALSGEKDRPLVGLWLLRGLAPLAADPKTHESFRRRVAVISELFPEAPKPPKADAKPEALAASAKALLEWWASRS